MLYDMGNYNNVLKYYKAYIVENPHDAPVRAKIARCLLEHGDLEGALSEGQLAVENGPELVEPYYVLGLILMDQNKLSEAKSSFEQALVIDPASPLGSYGLGILAMNQN